MRRCSFAVCLLLALCTNVLSKSINLAEHRKLDGETEVDHDAKALTEKTVEKGDVAVPPSSSVNPSSSDSTDTSSCKDGACRPVKVAPPVKPMRPDVSSQHIKLLKDITKAVSAAFGDDLRMSSPRAHALPRSTLDYLRKLSDSSTYTTSMEERAEFATQVLKQLRVISCGHTEHKEAPSVFSDVTWALLLVFLTFIPSVGLGYWYRGSKIPTRSNTHRNSIVEAVAHMKSSHAHEAQALMLSNFRFWSLLVQRVALAALSLVAVQVLFSTWASVAQQKATYDYILAHPDPRCDDATAYTFTGYISGLRHWVFGSAKDPCITLYMARNPYAPIWVNVLPAIVRALMDSVMQVFVGALGGMGEAAEAFRSAFPFLLQIPVMLGLLAVVLLSLLYLAVERLASMFLSRGYRISTLFLTIEPTHLSGSVLSPTSSDHMSAPSVFSGSEAVRPLMHHPQQLSLREQQHEDGNASRHGARAGRRQRRQIRHDDNASSASTQPVITEASSDDDSTAEVKGE